MTKKLSIEEIARLIYLNHEEQCCTCEEWGQEIHCWRNKVRPWDAEKDAPAFWTPAKAIHEAIYGKS